MRCYIIPPNQYVSKANWNVDSEGWVNANPVLIQSGPFAGSYAIPEDFFYELVVDGSPLNTTMWNRMQGKMLDNVASFNTPPPPEPPVVPPPPEIPTPQPTVPSTYVWPVGSLGEHVTQQISSRLVGKEPMSACPIFTTQNHAGGIYVRNQNCWANLDLTGISVYNTWDGVRGAGTMVTRRHGVCSAHFMLYGTPILRFLKADGTLVERQAIYTKTHPAYNPPVTHSRYPDFAVFVLDQDLPADIKHYKLLPSNFSDYLPDAQLEAGWPSIFGTNQQEVALVACLRRAGQLDSQWFSHSPPRFGTPERSFYVHPAKGDSSSGYFLVIDGEPVLVFVLTGNGGTKLHPLINDINQLISDVDIIAGFSTGYTVETVDLSGFPTY